MTRSQKYLFLAIIALAVFLLFFRLGRHDMLGDDGHYAFRSIGYFDYMASLEQTTPLQWFPERPSWSYLSFHDHPPLFFLLQFLFLKIFPDSVVGLRLLPAIAALGSAVVLFFLAKRMGSTKAGLLALAALVFNNYFIWTGRIGHQESLLIFFLLLGLLYFTKALQESGKGFGLSGLFFGLAFLTKYSFLFILPGVLVYLLLYERWVFGSKKFWIGLMVFFIVCSPVLIYNLNMYQTRGHFDVQFSDLFRQEHHDWDILQKRIATAGFNVVLLWRVLLEGLAWPYFVLFLVSLLNVIYLTIQKRLSKYTYLILLIFLSLYGFLTLAGAADRWVGIISPFAALIIGLGLGIFLETSAVKIDYKYLLVPLLILIFGFSLVFILNTNHFRRPLGLESLYSNLRVENYGYNQLDKKISKLLTQQRAPADIQESVRLWWYSDLPPGEVKFRQLQEGYGDFRYLIVYDSNTNWFPTMWVFERWKLRHRFFIATSEEYFKIVKEERSLQALKDLNLYGIYWIEAGEEVASQSRINFPESKIITDNYKQQGIEPEIIYDDKGRVAFSIYYGTFK